MRLVFMGTPEFSVPSLQAILRDGHDLAAVVTRPDRPRRHRAAPPEPSPVKRAAAAAGLPVLQPASVREPGFRASLAGLAPEALVVVAFGQILPPEILAVPQRGSINLHASLLPKYRGAAPVARAIMAGEAVTGLTTMLMERGLDTGDILLQKECAIGPEETAGELTARLAPIGADLLVETLALHARSALAPRPQDHGAATLAPPLTQADGEIDWRSPAGEIARRVRGCRPWPIARTTLGGSIVQILAAGPAAEAAPPPGGSPPGRVVAAGGDEILVQCGGGSCLALREVRFPGRRAMPARDALNGRLIRMGDTLGAASAG